MQALPELSFTGIVSELKPFTKYVEEFAVTIPAGSTSATHTLNQTVDPSKTIRLYNNKKFSTLGDYNQINPRISLTDGNTITATKTTTSIQDVIVRGVVIELFPWAIEDLEEGTLAIGTGASSSSVHTLNNTVAADYNRTVVFWLGTTTDGTGGGIGTSFTYLDLTTSTHLGVQAYIGQTGKNTVTGWCAIKFAKGIIRQKILVDATISNGSTTSSVTVATVDMNKTLSAPGGYSYSSGFEGDHVAGQLTSATAFGIQRSDNFPTSHMRVTLLELYDDYIVSVQRGVTAFTLDANTTDITINPVDLAKSFSTHMGVNSSYQFSLFGETTPTLFLNDNHTLRLDRLNGTDFGHATSEGWEVVNLR